MFIPECPNYRNVRQENLAKHQCSGSHVKILTPDSTDNFIDKPDETPMGSSILPPIYNINITIKKAILNRTLWGRDVDILPIWLHGDKELNIFLKHMNIKKCSCDKLKLSPNENYFNAHHINVVRGQYTKPQIQQIKRTMSLAELN